MRATSYPTFVPLHRALLTTLGLYGGSTFLSYNICQSMLRKNGWFLISSYDEQIEKEIIYYYCKND